jgi:hypothetical protein
MGQPHMRLEQEGREEEGQHDEKGRRRSHWSDCRILQGFDSRIRRSRRSPSHVLDCKGLAPSGYRIRSLRTNHLVRDHDLLGVRL